MGRCCGGKNAGKPISWPRYLAGVGVFLTYHTGVQALLTVAAMPVCRLRIVRDFHRRVYLQDLKEILARVDININGPDPTAEAEACEPAGMPEARGGSPEPAPRRAANE